MPDTIDYGKKMHQAMRTLIAGVLQDVDQTVECPGLKAERGLESGRRRLAPSSKGTEKNGPLAELDVQALHPVVQRGVHRQRLLL